MKKGFYFFLLLLPAITFGQYLGSGSVSQGTATAISGNLYNCAGGRIATVGTITAVDNSTWTVPAQVNFTNTAFPFASDLYNACNGFTYSTSSSALAALTGSDIVVIDPTGEVITAYIFADNYFEMYVNGVQVGKDKVPYTEFNSSIVRFKVNRPFTIAMLLVDWEEHLGIGSELNGPSAYHDGDGGMVAVFKDANNNTIDITGNDWKAQTFYTSPITDLTCPTENGTQRLSGNCSTQDSNNGLSYYALHWSKPANWTSASFNDATWPNATLYTNATIGVSNKPSYMNFTSIFDDPTKDAQFIWSTNVILDNEVIVRHTVSAASSIFENKDLNDNIKLYPNPIKNEFYIDLGDKLKSDDISKISIYNSIGERIFESNTYSKSIKLESVASGVYFVKISVGEFTVTKKLIVN